MGRRDRHGATARGSRGGAARRDHDATELALDRAGVKTVLWAGGFRPAFSWIELPILDELGFPRATRGVSEVPGLAFVGLPWLYKRKSPLLLGVAEDAAHVADAVATQLGEGSEPSSV